MKARKFYAIWAINGLGVVDSWERVTESRKYIYKLKVRKCNTFKEAEAKAIREYNALRYKNYKSGFKGKLPLNFVLNNSNIKNWNQWW